MATGTGVEEVRTIAVDRIGVTPGRRIAARRSELALSRGEVETRSGGTIYVKLLARIETGFKDLATLSLGKLVALSDVLEWSLHDLLRDTGLGDRAPILFGTSSRHPSHGMPALPRSLTESEAGAAWLRARRAWLDLVQADVVERSGGVITQSLLSRLESGQRTLDSLSVEQAEALLDVLDWSLQDLAVASGVGSLVPSDVWAMADTAPDDIVAVPVLPPLDPTHDRLPDPYGPNDRLPVLAPLTPDLPIDPTTLAYLPVGSQTLVSETLAALLPPGTMILIEREGKPARGDIVAAIVPGHGIALMRHPGRASAVLRTHDANGPVVRVGGHPVRPLAVARQLHHALPAPSDI